MSVCASRERPKKVFASLMPVPLAGTIVAPVAPAPFAASTIWSVISGFTFDSQAKPVVM